MDMALPDFHPVNIPKERRDIIWSERSLSLPDILKELQLPVVIKMNADDQKEGGATYRRDASAMLKQPLLLFQESKGFKIVARNVSNLVAVTSRDGVKYQEGGSVIVLPVDYSGWFRVLEEDTVPLLNIAGVARVMPVSFLATKRITGFTLLDPLNRKDIMYEKLEFPPGVFTLHSVFEDYVKYQGEKNSTKRKLLRCIVCATSDGLDILIPFDVQGEFYIVGHKKTVSKSVKAEKVANAYTLKQLVAMGVFTRPLVLKLLIGDPPTKPCGFTGVMKVFDIIKDWTVIAMTLDGKRKLIELPVLPFPEFTPSSNGRDLLEAGSLRAELAHMRSGVADKYAKEIKVRASFNLQQQKAENGVKEDELPPINEKKALPMPERL